MKIMRAVCAHCTQPATCSVTWYALPNDQHEGKNMGPRCLCDDCANDLRRSEAKGAGVAEVTMRPL